MIILSPIGLLMRDATDTSRSCVEDVGDVPLRSRLQRRVDEPAVLHAREVGRPLLAGDFLLQPADVFVLVLDLADRLIAIPQHLQAELQLVLHLVQHVAERLGGRAQQLDDVLARLEDPCRTTSG